MIRNARRTVSLDVMPAEETTARAHPREAQPTLLVFTLGARAERRRRPLLPGRCGGAELELRRRLLDAALEAGREAGCRLVISSPQAPSPVADAAHQTQTGGHFGDRLEAAVDAAAVGGGPLVVVGTDVPGLGAEHLRQALAAVAADPEAVVLGPSPDGGFYLLATARPLPGLAGLTRWCRSDTLAGLTRSLERAGRRVVLLAPLTDLDRRRDLERWLARLPRRLSTAWRAFVRRLVDLLDRLLRPLLPPPAPQPLRVPVPVRRPRGPPRRR